jgi:hypothetical protein
VAIHLLRTDREALRIVTQVQPAVWLWALLAGGTACILIAAAVFTSAVTDTPIGFLLRDPNAIARQPLFYGALETAGIVVMACAGGATLFASSLCKASAARFLLMGGLLTMLLVADDLYMLHENTRKLGLDDSIAFGTYLAATLVFAVVNLRYLLGSPISLFIASSAFFAAALTVDAIPGLERQLPRGSEDFLEVIGICYWSAYFVKCGRDALLATQRT